MAAWVEEKLGGKTDVGNGRVAGCTAGGRAGVICAKIKNNTKTSVGRVRYHKRKHDNTPFACYVTVGK